MPDQVPEDRSHIELLSAYADIAWALHEASAAMPELRVEQRLIRTQLVRRFGTELTDRLTDTMHRFIEEKAD